MLRGLLSAGKVLALALFIAIAGALVVYLAHHRNRPSQGKDRPRLQGRIAIFNNTRYVHEVQGRVRFVLTAAVDNSYEDGTHELEHVRLESHGTDGTRDDIVTADRAKISNTADLDKLQAEFLSNVSVVTTEALILKTSYLKYNSTKNTVETPAPVWFTEKNMEGKAVGMLIEAAEERVHLLKDADVTLKPEAPTQQAPNAQRKPSGHTPATATVPPHEPTAEEIAARKERKRARKLAREKAAESAPKETHTEKAVQVAAAPKGKGATLAGGPKSPIHITGNSALLDKKQRQCTFTGNVVVTQAVDSLRADSMVAFLNASNQIERIEARGNSDLKEESQGEVKSRDMDFFLAAGQRLDHAVATGGVYAQSLGGTPAREAKGDTAEVTFVEGPDGNTIDTIKAAGHAYLIIHAPSPEASKNPATRELAGDDLTLHFFPDGRDLETADVAGNAVMTITPTRAEKGADKKTIRAPHMNAIFFEDGNRVKSFNAGAGVRVELDSLVKDAHPPRVTTSKTLDATFTADTQDIERVTQGGDFKYNEGERNAVAEKATYTGDTQLLELRGKRPMGWDSTHRLQADEIDYDNEKDLTHARGDVRTTYYNEGSTGDSAPFGNTKSPVYITADRADAQNDDSVAVYTGHARGWQDDNFLSADRIELYKDDKRTVAVGHVDSALYTMERETSPGKREIVPAFAAADHMTYSDEKRLVHYDGHVKSRQGTDRLDSDSVDVYLKQDTNDVDRMIANGSVKLQQPDRRGSGDKLVYTTLDGRGVLTGRDARVDDVNKGSTMGRELTFYSRDDKIFVDNQHGPGRVRSIHRLQTGKENR